VPLITYVQICRTEKQQVVSIIKSYFFKNLTKSILTNFTSYAFSGCPGIAGLQPFYLNIPG